MVSEIKEMSTRHPWGSHKKADSEKKKTYEI